MIYRFDGFELDTEACTLERRGRSIDLDAQVYEPARSERGEGRKNPLCFASTSWYEIAAGGKKLIGSAQRRWSGHFLQHGSILLEESPAALLTGKMERSPWISENQTSLSALLPSLPPLTALTDALKAGFESALDIRLILDEMTLDERTCADRLVLEKYGNPRWNRFRETGT